MTVHRYLLHTSGKNEIRRNISSFLMLLVNFQEIRNNETFCLLFLFHNSPHLLRLQNTVHNEDQCSFCLSFYLQISLSVHLS